MPLLGPSTDYTDKDFTALRARLRNLIRSTFPEWMDEDVVDFGNLMVELFAFVGDVVTKYQDNQGGEAFIGRATQRKNMLALCKLLGFTPRGNTAAQVDLSMWLPTALAEDFTVPARTRVRTDAVVEPVFFETQEDLLIPAGEVGPFTVPAENAEQREEPFTATSLPNQEIRLSGTPFLDASLSIEDTAGAYEVVDNFLDSSSTERHCTVVVDQDDRATVRFGNGVNGALPIGTITITYKVGGGTRGRVEANKLTRVEDVLTDSGGSTVPLKVNNPTPSTRALDRQTVEEIRVRAPVSLRALTRTVAREDFEIRALEVAGVARALMLTSDQEPGINENSGILFIVPDGGGSPPQQIRDDVLERVTVTFPCTTTFQVAVQSALYQQLNVRAVVHLGKSTSELIVRARIQARLEFMLAISKVDGSPNPDVDFGYYLKGEEEAGSFGWSDVFNEIRDTPGVRRIDPGPEGLLLNGERDNVALSHREFPVLGTVEIINAASGAVMPLDDAFYLVEYEAERLRRLAL